MEAQLSLEKVGREITAQGRIFGPDCRDIQRLIRGAESYVQHVIKDWERFGPEIVAGADADHTKAKLKHLQQFLDKAKKGGFKQEVSDPLEEPWSADPQPDPWIVDVGRYEIWGSYRPQPPPATSCL